MLTEALTALASTGGTALVTAMVTDSWEEFKGRFARLLGRGDIKGTQAAAARLEQSRTALAAAPGPARERTRAEQQIAWQTRLADLLEQDPAAENELRALITQVPAARSTGQVQVHASAFDYAQQAVQGHGVQNVTFGGRHGPGPGSQ
jgi:hypothetical protein